MNQTTSTGNAANVGMTVLLLQRFTVFNTCCVALAVYESEEYYRAAVEPELEDGSKVPADVYIWKAEHK
jgi:hypothetical protein